MHISIITINIIWCDVMWGQVMWCDVEMHPSAHLFPPVLEIHSIHLASPQTASEGHWTESLLSPSAKGFKWCIDIDLMTALTQSYKYPLWWEISWITLRASLWRVCVCVRLSLRELSTTHLNNADTFPALHFLTGVWNLVVAKSNQRCNTLPVGDLPFPWQCNRTADLPALLEAGEPKGYAKISSVSGCPVRQRN